MASEVYTLRLTLERVPGQRPMEEIIDIPKPSQLDEWSLYEQLERDRIRQTQGQVKFDSWTMGRNIERIERDQWRRSREFRISMREKEEGKGKEHDEATSGSHSMVWNTVGAGGQPQRRKLSDIDTDLLPPSEADED